MAQLDGILALRGPRDLFRKLEADLDRFRSAPTVSCEAQYAAYDFFVTAEHIPDWVSALTGQSKASLRNYPDGALVSHIANGAKHFHVDPSRHTTVKDTKVHHGAFQEGAFDHGGFDVSELLIMLEDGSYERVLSVAMRVRDHWHHAALPEHPAA
jgi:hypothetical protein